jgi:hypothetical protein
MRSFHLCIWIYTFDSGRGQRTYRYHSQQLGCDSEHITYCFGFEQLRAVKSWTGFVSIYNSVDPASVVSSQGPPSFVGSRIDRGRLFQWYIGLRFAVVGVSGIVLVNVINIKL